MTHNENTKAPPAPRLFSYAAAVSGKATIKRPVENRQVDDKQSSSTAEKTASEAVVALNDALETTRISNETENDDGYSIDSFLVAALGHPKDRNLVLHLDDDLFFFVSDPTAHRLEFPPMHSYHRLVVHRVAQYYGLSHVVDSVKRAVILYKAAETQLPLLKLAEWIPLEEVASPLISPVEAAVAVPPQPVVRIMKRSTNQNSSEQSSNTLDITTETDESKAAKQREMEERILAEKEAAYQRARARIFEEESAHVEGATTEPVLNVNTAETTTRQASPLPATVADETPPNLNSSNSSRLSPTATPFNPVSVPAFVPAPFMYPAAMVLPMPSSGFMPAYIQAPLEWSAPSPNRIPRHQYGNLVSYEGVRQTGATTPAAPGHILQIRHVPASHDNVQVLLPFLQSLYASVVIVKRQQKGLFLILMPSVSKAKQVLDSWPSQQWPDVEWRQVTLQPWRPFIKSNTAPPFQSVKQ